jgi:hypothetical protein
VSDLRIPGDIQTIYAFLGQILVELSDVAEHRTQPMAMAVREWRGELRDAVRDWREGSPEPDWQAFREWMNDICRDDGMPALFSESEEG